MRVRERDLTNGSGSAGGARVGSVIPGVAMAALAPLPPLPPQFKSIQHHLRTAQEHDKRDPVVAYYCESFRGPHTSEAGCRPRPLALDRCFDRWPALGIPWGPAVLWHPHLL